MRTVRFDQQGKPKALRRFPDGPERAKHRSVRLFLRMKKRLHRFPGQKRPLLCRGRNRNPYAGRRRSTRQALAMYRKDADMTNRDVQKTENTGRHSLRQAMTARKGTEHGRERYPRSHDRPQGQGRPTSDRNNRGEGRSNGPTRQRPAGGPGNRPGAHPGNHPELVRGIIRRTGREAGDGKPAVDAAQSQTSRPHDKPAHRKKDKRDYERSRREREGTSLMAQSMKMGRKKRHVSDRKPAAAAPTEAASAERYCQGTG